MSIFNPNRTCACCNLPVIADGVEVKFNVPDVMHFYRTVIRQKVTGNEDLLTYDDHYYIRGVLPIKVINSERAFHIGMWVEVSRPDFDKYLLEYNSDEIFTFDGTHTNNVAYLMDPLGLSVSVTTRDRPNRPIITVTDTTSELYRAQQQGLHEHELTHLFPNQL